jgi:drug/metabolite transporter (DMT)-like permease
LNQHARIEPIAPAATAEPPSGNAALASALFTVFVWALSFPLTRIALADLQPLALAAARFAIASLLVLAWLAWKRPRLPSRGDSARFALCGLIGIALYNALLNAGQQTVGAGAASFIVNTVPILTALLATLFLKERLTIWGWAGAGLGFAGVAIIVTGQPGGFALGSGAFLIFGSAVAQAVFFVIQRPLVPRYGALASTAYTLLAGAVMLAPWIGAGFSTLAAAETAQSTRLAVIALAALPAVLGYAAWAHALGHFGAARAATFLYLVPPTATLLAFALAGETPGPSTVLGGLVAIAGVALVNARGRSG